MPDASSSLAPGLIVAAPASGQGKTTLALGLIAAFARAGIAVRSFKVGPDYIDPAFHAAASGRPCLNLDPWAMRGATLDALACALVADAGLAWDAPAPFEGTRSMGEALLEPTRIYVKPVLRAIRETGAVKALAHITGGGLSENVPRVLPDGIAAHIDLGAWTAPPVFGWLMEAGGLDGPEMLRTFNCGIGMVIVVAPDGADSVMRELEAAGEAPIRIGELEPGRGVKSQAKGKGEAEAVRYSGRQQR